MAYLNQHCRSQEAAKAALGTIIFVGGVEYRCEDHNDLGVLYWRVYGRDGKPKGKLLVDSYLDHRANLRGAY